MSSIVVSGNSDPAEARLEAQEVYDYLLAKSYFDCREFERCTSVFFPPGLSGGSVPSSISKTEPISLFRSTKNAQKDIFPKSSHSLKESILLHDRTNRLSQKALFLTLYSKYMAGEKRKEEATEMVLGPADKASVINTELVDISRVLKSYFTARDPQQGSDGWLEYLYGMVLSKGKNEEDSKQWLLRSVHLFPYNWGAWIELSNLLNSIEEVSSLKQTEIYTTLLMYLVQLHELVPKLPQNIMTIIFNLHANQVLYQSTEQIHRQSSDLEVIFPQSLFLKTEKALLFYHSRGQYILATH